jgi:hypothetical protein
MTQATNEIQQALANLQALADQLNQNDELDITRKAQALNCLEAMRSRLTAGQSPEKVQWDNLVKSVEASPPITDRVVQLGEDFGYMPSA